MNVPAEVRAEFEASLDADIQSWGKEVHAHVRKYERGLKNTPGHEHTDGIAEKLAKRKHAANYYAATEARHKTQADLAAHIKKCLDAIARQAVAEYRTLEAWAEAEFEKDWSDVPRDDKGKWTGGGSHAKPEGWQHWGPGKKAAWTKAQNKATALAAPKPAATAYTYPKPAAPATAYPKPAAPAAASTPAPDVTSPAPTTGGLDIGRMEHLSDYEKGQRAGEEEKRLSGNWYHSLSAEEKGALSYYKGSGYQSVNQALRGSGVLSAQVAAQVDHLDTAFAKGSLPEPITVYRGYGGNSGLIQQLGNGQAHVDAGYTSASLRPSVAAGFSGLVRKGDIARIELPAGLKGGFIHGMSEHEFVMARGTRVAFVSSRTVKISGSGDYRKEITLRAYQPGIGKLLSSELRKFTGQLPVPDDKEWNYQDRFTWNDDDGGEIVEVDLDDLASLDHGQQAAVKPVVGKSAEDDFDDEFDLLAELAGKSIETATLDAAKRAIDSLEITDTEITGLLHKEALAYAEKRGAELVGRRWVNGKLVRNPNADWSITQTTRDGLRSLLEAAYEEGFTPATLAKEIASSYAFSEARAEMIARTETNKASSTGTLIGWRNSGVVEGKEWLLSEDHDDGLDCECPDNADQGVIPVDDDFQDGSDSPPAHPNCMCSMVATVIDDADEADE